MGGSGNLPIGPGVLGFIAAFVLALSLWLLMRNMNSRMRRMAYRERDRVEVETQRLTDKRAAKGSSGVDDIKDSDRDPDSGGSTGSDGSDSSSD